MKAITNKYKQDFNFEVLSQDELYEVRGGIEPPKTRDKDVFEFEED
ncbi:hypothetical protein [uncultured Draconibacterium sp.]|nr:hypothetical protein [uncultured Draconibacterium sp.]